MPVEKAAGKQGYRAGNLSWEQCRGGLYIKRDPRYKWISQEKKFDYERFTTCNGDATYP